MSDYPSFPNKDGHTYLISGLISGVLIFAFLGCILILAGVELWVQQPVVVPDDTEEIIDAPEQISPPVTDTPQPTATATATATATPTATATATATSTATATQAAPPAEPDAAPPAGPDSAPPAGPDSAPQPPPDSATPTE